MAFAKITRCQDWICSSEHDPEGRGAADPAELQRVQQTLIDTLGQFGICGRAPATSPKGPTITRYEVYPAKGVRVDKIVSLERDLARATRAERINILAPIPGKDTVGIELANTRKVTVTLRELLQSTTGRKRRSARKFRSHSAKTFTARPSSPISRKCRICLSPAQPAAGKSVCINA